MELFLLIKILTLLICFEITYSKVNINKSSEEEKDSIKEAKECKPISYLLQDSKDKSTTPKLGLDYFKIDAPVKYIYINNYDYYDISGLLKKSSREEIDYTANLNSTKIIYNFKDLKKTDKCNYDGKQIFEISNNSDSCQPLAGAMGNGNTWDISFDRDGKKLIQIQLNQEKNNTHVTYLLKCAKLKNYDIREDKSSYESNNGITNLVLYIETIYACPTYEKFILLEWIEHFHIFVGIVFILLSGLITLVSITPEGSYGIMSYLITFLSVISIVKIFFPPMMRFWKLWIILVACIIFSGILLSFIYYKINSFYFKYVFGAYLGFFLGQYFYDLFIEVIVWNSLFFYLLFIFLFILFGILLSHFSIYTAIYIASSYFAAYTFLRGASLFSGYFPSEYYLVLLKINGEVGQIEKLITWRFYVYNCFAFGVGTIVFIIRIIMKKDEWNRELNIE